MNIPKKVIGWWFFITGFIAFGYIGYLQINKLDGMWPIAIITLSFCGSWYALFDYVRGVENANK